MLGSCKLEFERGAIVGVAVWNVLTRGVFVGGATSGELVGGYTLGRCRELTSWRWLGSKEAACKLERWLHVQEIVLWEVSTHWEAARRLNRETCVGRPCIERHTWRLD